MAMDKWWTLELEREAGKDGRRQSRLHEAKELSEADRHGQTMTIDVCCPNSKASPFPFHKT
ncbi:hypothetical protein BT69DRAFT_1279100 [Atractiella rhizophila]|nr:hypothetical protein BT69DRAFT_1279100 [Atractiella rhizophila]